MNISVIIPTYNRRESLCNALDSVLRQTYMPDEIIVIDDGSSDNTENMMANKYPDVRYIYQPHSGVSSARNNGILNSTNHWIAFLDSDDKWHKNKIKIQSKLLALNPEYKICHCNEIWFKNHKKINQKKKHQKNGGYIFTKCLPLCVISPSSVIIHRDIFKRIGTFDESLPACEDYDLWLRICSKYPLLYAKDKLVEKYGGHPDQLSTKYWGMDRFRIKSLANLLDSGILSDTQRKNTIDTLNYKLNIYINGAHKHNNEVAAEEFKILAKRYSYSQT
jgi:glycosyltransferase involved in cell wall biosynthesis